MEGIARGLETIVYYIANTDVAFIILSIIIGFYIVIVCMAVRRCITFVCIIISILFPFIVFKYTPERWQQ